jgi:hypothetical protein
VLFGWQGICASQNKAKKQHLTGRSESDTKSSSSSTVPKTIQDYPMAIAKKAKVKSALKSKKIKTEKKDKHAGGRPSKFEDKMIEQAYHLALLGATEARMATIFGVSDVTLDNWKLTKPEFLGALKRGKDEADALVSKALYNRALGFTHKEEKIFCSDGQVIRAETIKQYPPDTVACIFWLKNRQKEQWRDKVEHTVQGGDKPVAIDMSGYSKDEREVLRALVSNIAVSARQDP